ncbi:hypothetical protein NAPIS_ORF00458 [Vairimorpha apis BRL 01]|uniref:Uncharacterized protein n=1 Tax=Vairimorpha apis BRL 01 TaxID=1037528 RepID=T0MFV9_9MICR|nr:hypothetical protein NAPIS_ORF00458 [Vairimorpha apis BRL 01]
MIYLLFVISIINFIKSTVIPRSILSSSLKNDKIINHSTQPKKKVYFSNIIEYNEPFLFENDNVQRSSQRYFKTIDIFPERSNAVDEVDSINQDQATEKNEKYKELEQFNDLLNNFDIGYNNVEDLCKNLNIPYPIEQKTSTQECLNINESDVFKEKK